LPNILVIVLKRFEFNYDEMRKIKINSYLKFPDVLNMQKYTADYLAGDHSGDEA
jgi:ubiquitin carboxyl-terminal hydrolase 9/24